jgi:hypothetical protein
MQAHPERANLMPYIEKVIDKQAASNTPGNHHPNDAVTVQFLNKRGRLQRMRNESCTNNIHIWRNIVNINLLALGIVHELNKRESRAEQSLLRPALAEGD